MKILKTISCVLFFQVVFFIPLYAASVIIIAGQSNSYRLGLISSGDIGLANTVQYYTRKCIADGVLNPTYKALNSLNPNSSGTALVMSMINELDEDLVVVHLARCGSPIGFPGNGDGNITWYPGDDPQAGRLYNDGIYADLLQFYNNAKTHFTQNNPGHEWNLKAIFWHQGEGDSNLTKSRRHEKNFRNMLYRFRQDFPLVPFIAGEIREKDPNGNTWPNPFAAVINKGLNNVANDLNVPGFYLVETGDLSFSDNYSVNPPVYNVHMGLAGMTSMGIRMFFKYKAAVNEKDKSASDTILRY